MFDKNVFLSHLVRMSEIAEDREASLCKVDPFRRQADCIQFWHQKFRTVSQQPPHSTVSRYQWVINLHCPPVSRFIEARAHKQEEVSSRSQSRTDCPSLANGLRKAGAQWAAQTRHQEQHLPSWRLDAGYCWRFLSIKSAVSCVKHFPILIYYCIVVRII